MTSIRILHNQLIFYPNERTFTSFNFDLSSTVKHHHVNFYKQTAIYGFISIPRCVPHFLNYKYLNYFSCNSISFAKLLFFKINLMLFRAIHYINLLKKNKKCFEKRCLADDIRIAWLKKTSRRQCLLLLINISDHIKKGSFKMMVDIRLQSEVPSDDAVEIVEPKNLVTPGSIITRGTDFMR